MIRNEILLRLEKIDKFNSNPFAKNLQERF